MSKTPPSTRLSKASPKVRKTSDALEILGERFTRHDPAMLELVERATVNALVAKLIYEARTAAKLTQKQLADLVGTTQPVIARLEDSDYEGHSLSLLHRIAKALQLRLDIKLIPDTASPRSA
jgi:ribosome-binding protein aMBF1 (putative translation factor)